MWHNATVFVQWLIYWGPSSSHGSLPKEGPQTLVPSAVLEVLSHLIAFGAGYISCDVFLYKTDEGKKRFSPKWACQTEDPVLGCSIMEYCHCTSLIRFHVITRCCSVTMWQSKLYNFITGSCETAEDGTDKKRYCASVRNIWGFSQLTETWNFHKYHKNLGMEMTCYSAVIEVSLVT